MFYSCNKDEEQQVPYCKIVSPQNEDSVKYQSKITIKVDAHIENSQIKEVAFYINDEKVGVSTTEPYEVSVKTDAYIDNCKITVIARADNGTETSDNINIYTYHSIKYGESVEDIDGNIYKTIWIGNQLWMAENLKSTHYPDGKEIPHIQNDSIWGDLEDNNMADAYCYYSNSNDNRDKYGALYTYAAAKDACPAGWHLPDEKEWTELQTNLKHEGFEGIEGSALKSKDGWITNNGFDSYGFRALPGGGRCFDGPFDFVEEYARWWSGTEHDAEFSWGHGINYNDTILGTCYRPKSVGYSVRCVKDSNP
jgi:uncharacterized protein (TIGR02145 family)